MSESKGIVIEEQELREMARSARGCIQRIFLHWSGGHYGVNEDAYHLCVDRDGQVYVNCRKLSEEKAHTWLRNSNAAVRKRPTPGCATAMRQPSACCAVTAVIAGRRETETCVLSTLCMWETAARIRTMPSSALATNRRRRFRSK